MSRVGPAAAAALLLLLAACAPEPPVDAPGADGGTAAEDPVTPPSVEGAVLTVAGVPILRAELEELADAAALATPEYTRPQHRRLALDQELIPRAALEARWGAERTAARAEAEAALAALRADPAAAVSYPVRQELVDVRQLGLAPWYAVQRGPLGKWLGPAEDHGRWFVLRWLAAGEAPTRAQSRLSVELVEFRYVPGEEVEPFVDEALSGARLEVHDVEVGELVTERMRWRMAPR